MYLGNEFCILLSGHVYWPKYWYRLTYKRLPHPQVWHSAQPAQEASLATPAPTWAAAWARAASTTPPTQTSAPPQEVRNRSRRTRSARSECCLTQYPGSTRIWINTLSASPHLQMCSWRKGQLAVLLQLWETLWIWTRWEELLRASEEAGTIRSSRIERYHSCIWERALLIV